jgi:hypothetical protein
MQSACSVRGYFLQYGVHKCHVCVSTIAFGRVGVHMHDAFWPQCCSALWPLPKVRAVLALQFESLQDLWIYCLQLYW